MIESHTGGEFGPPEMPLPIELGTSQFLQQCTSICIRVWIVLHLNIIMPEVIGVKLHLVDVDVEKKVDLTSNVDVELDVDMDMKLDVELDVDVVPISLAT